MVDVDAMVDEVAPTDAYQILTEDPASVLVDVRSRAEWTFVGVPDLSAIGKQIWPVEWQQYPGMAVNPGFLASIDALIDKTGACPRHMLFICRSGARSLSAAAAVSEHLRAREVRCTNVAEGFEGGLDTLGHRGLSAGWKARGLPWVQN